MNINYVPMGKLLRELREESRVPAERFAADFNIDLDKYLDSELYEDNSIHINIVELAAYYHHSISYIKRLRISDSWEREHFLKARMRRNIAC